MTLFLFLIRKSVAVAPDSPEVQDFMMLVKENYPNLNFTLYQVGTYGTASAQYLPTVHTVPTLPTYRYPGGQAFTVSSYSA